MITNNLLRVAMNFTDDVESYYGGGRSYGGQPNFRIEPINDLNGDICFDVFSYSATIATFNTFTKKFAINKAYVGYSKSTNHHITFARAVAECLNLEEVVY